MLTIWCFAISPLPSVKGIVKTVGKVPPASCAVKVGAVQSYSAGFTVIHGYLASNSLIWRFSASTASWVAPGRRTPTVMVTGSCAAAADALAAGAVLVAGGVLAAGEGVVVVPPQATTIIAVIAAKVATTDGKRRVSDRIECAPLIGSHGGRPAHPPMSWRSCLRAR